MDANDFPTGLKNGDKIIVRTNPAVGVGDVVTYNRTTDDGISFALSPKLNDVKLRWDQIVHCEAIA